MSLCHLFFSCSTCVDTYLCILCISTVWNHRICHLNVCFCFRLVFVSYRHYMIRDRAADRWQEGRLQQWQFWKLWILSVLFCFIVNHVVLLCCDELYRWSEGVAVAKWEEKVYGKMGGNGNGNMTGNGICVCSVFPRSETIEYVLWMCVSVFVWFSSVAVTTKVMESIYFVLV